MSAASPTRWYQSQLTRPGFHYDAAQQRAIERLEQLHQQLLEFRKFRHRPFVKTLNLGTPPKGLFLHGGVGRGKSMLMDAFYATLPYRRKQRWHFHAFMREIHTQLAQLKEVEDPLSEVARQWAQRLRVLCLDEFHVNDIADAMMLGRLFERLFDHGVVLVATSNYAPSELYKDGLQRERFLPAIDILQRNVEVISVDGALDYRLQHLERLRTYITPLGAEAERELRANFEDIEPGGHSDATLSVNGRSVKTKRLGRGIVWFEFQELCVTARSQNDYLEIARGFHSVLLSNVPSMSVDDAAQARRFTWLVDILYDHRVKFMLSAQVAPRELYTAGTRSDEFQRTVSRLIEMQSREYLSSGHIT